MTLTYLDIQTIEQLFDLTWDATLLISLSAAGIYAAVILYTRIFGKRSFSKISSFDFAMTVAIGSLVASTILSESTSMLEGMAGILVVYILQLSMAILRRFDFIKKLIDNQPTLLMDGTNFLRENMKAVRVTEGDIRSKIREANVLNMKDLKAVIFETTGDIVVMHSSNSEMAIDEWLMNDVQR